MKNQKDILARQAISFTDEEKGKQFLTMEKKL